MFTRSKPVRVCLVAASLDILGGQSVQAARLLDGLDCEAQIEADFLPVNPRLPRRLRWLQRIKYVRTLVTLVAYVLSLLWRLPRYDVVHVYSAAYLSFLLAPAPAVLIAKLFGKPVLLNYHSGEAEDHLLRWQRTTRFIFNWCDLLVVPSQYLATVFAEFGFTTEIVANTVSMARFPYRARPALRPVLLSNRNLERMYNVANTLRAFKLICAQRPEARLLVAGEGSQRARLELLAAELELSNVEFLGRVEPAEMPALYERADLFVNSSEIDNMPLSIIESFASGLPVVTTEAGGIPFLVMHQSTGWLVPCSDEHALAETVLEVLRDEARALVVATAAHEQCRQYTWEAVRGEWLRLYRELAPDARGRRAVGNPPRAKVAARYR